MQPWRILLQLLLFKESKILQRSKKDFPWVHPPDCRFGVNIFERKCSSFIHSGDFYIYINILFITSTILHKNKWHTFDVVIQFAWSIITLMEGSLSQILKLQLSYRSPIMIRQIITITNSVYYYWGIIITHCTGSKNKHVKDYSNFLSLITACQSVFRVGFNRTVSCLINLVDWLICLLSYSGNGLLLLHFLS